MDENKIDQAVMGRLATAVAFICSVDHLEVLALQLAAETGTVKDIKTARTLFLRLKPAKRRAALTMLDV